MPGSICHYICTYSRVRQIVAGKGEPPVRNADWPAGGSGFPFWDCLARAPLRRNCRNSPAGAAGNNSRLNGDCTIFPYEVHLIIYVHVH